MRRRGLPLPPMTLLPPSTTPDPDAVMSCLPPLYPLQQDIVDSPGLRKVVVAGRRAGKTFLAAWVAARAMAYGLNVLIASTSQKQADEFWDYLNHWLGGLIQHRAVYKNESRRMLRYGNGRIHVRTGRDPNILRGAGVDVLILDECSRLAPTAWDEVGAPMLIDRPGSVAYFLSTPVSRNWYYHLYLKALDPTHAPTWATWHFPTNENPHLSATGFAELTRDMSELAYRQEILAEFLEGMGAVFRHVRDCTVPLVGPYTGPFVMGVDWGQQQDFTFLTVIDRSTRQVMEIDRFNQVSYILQRDRVKALHERWNCETIVVELNSIGKPNFEQLQVEGLPVWGFETTAASKPPLIQGLALALERMEIGIPSDPVLIGELEAFEQVISPRTYRASYEAPEGLHDDGVISLALAWYATSLPTRWVY